MSTEPLGPLLRRLRQGADLTLERLAELSGVSDRTISDIERGTSLGPQRRTVELLADALGLDEAVRESLLTAARAGRARPVATMQPRAPLPRAVADLTGRDAEMSAVVTHLASGAPGSPSPVAVVCGPPGFGKTSLAVRVATDLSDRFDDVLYVDLRGFDTRPLDPLSVLRRLIQAADPTARAIPRHADDAAAMWRTILGARRVLVVLDDAAGEHQVRPALPATGPSAVVVTSRRPLSGLEAPLRVDLDKLSRRDAVAMLRRIVRPEQAPGESLERLAALCDDVPLALRIAGNRVASRPSWTADDMADRLASEERRLEGLKAGDLEIRATLAMSYGQLSAAGRTLFRRLGTLAAPTIRAAFGAALASTDVAAAEDELDRLSDLGLLQPQGRGRYRVHDLVRLFAKERLHAEEDASTRSALTARLRTWMLATTVEAGRWFEPAFGHGPAEPGLVDLSTREAALGWLRDEVDHWFPAFQAAAAAGSDADVVEVAESLHWYSDLWMHWGHWHEVFESAVQAAERLGDDDALATQLGYLAWAEDATRNDPKRGLEHATRALAVARRADNATQEAWALDYMSRCETDLGHPEKALEHVLAARACFESAGDREGLMQAHRGVGMILGELGRFKEAIAADRAALALLDDPDHSVPRDVAMTTRVPALSMIARNLARLGDGEAALAAASQALSAVDDADAPQYKALCLRARAHALAAMGQVEAASADLLAAIDLRESIGDQDRADIVRRDLEELLANSGPATAQGGGADPASA